MAYKMRMPNGTEALWVTSAEWAQIKAVLPRSEAPAWGSFYGMPVHTIPEPKPLTRWQRVVTWFAERWKSWTARMRTVTP